MHFYDSRIRVQHPCPFCDLSVAFPEAEMSLWCNRMNEVFHISLPSRSQLEEALMAVERTLGGRQIICDGSSALTITRECLCDKYRSVSSIADECECWLVPPTTYSGGWEAHRVFSASKASLRRFVDELGRTGRIEIVSHAPRERLDFLRDMVVVPVHFFEGLTNRQVQALVSAYEHGLLDLPARKRMDRVAKMEGVSRSTFGEHLRKAQLQILRNSYPFLKLRAAGLGDRRDRTAVK